MLLDDAIDWVVDHVEEGAVCPCCSQLAKVWRITPKGIAFAERQIVVAKFVFVFDEVPVRHEGWITIEEALGERFNYKELVGRE